MSLALALAGLSFLLTVIWGGPLMRILRHYKIGQKIQVLSPSQHFTKLGTLTMGGMLIIVPVALLTVLLNAVTLMGFTVLGNSILLPLAVMGGYGLLGMWSDWLHVRGVRRSGLRIRTKFLAQIIIAAPTAYALYHLLDAPHLYLPFYNFEFKLGVWYLPLAVFIIVGSANAVNLTGGIDGLAGLIATTIFAAYGAIALSQGQIYLARFCFTLVGALLGFLWFNIKPAALLMGNTGTLALGALLAVIALMTAQWVLLPIIAIVPVSETSA